MKHYIVADRYARALARALPDTERMKQALEGLETLVELHETHHDFRNVLDNPAIPIAQRTALVGEVLHHLHIEVDEVKRLFREMLHRRRISQIGDVAVIFSKLLDERLNQTQARVVSATPLTPEQRAEVEAALEAYTGKKIHGVYATNPGLLGGLKAEVGGMVIDGTVRSQLRRLRDAILAE